MTSYRRYCVLPTAAKEYCVTQPTALSLSTSYPLCTSYSHCVLPTRRVFTVYFLLTVYFLPAGVGCEYSDAEREALCEYKKLRERGAV